MLLSAQVPQACSHEVRAELSRMDGCSLEQRGGWLVWCIEPSLTGRLSSVREHTQKHLQSSYRMKPETMLLARISQTGQTRVKVHLTSPLLSHLHSESRTLLGLATGHHIHALHDVVLLWVIPEEQQKYVHGWHVRGRTRERQTLPSGHLRLTGDPCSGSRAR